MAPCTRAARRLVRPRPARSTSATSTRPAGSTRTGAGPRSTCGCGPTAAARRPAAARLRGHLRVRHDAARHRAAAPRHDVRTTASCRWPASTTRCGSTGRSGPTSGCCTTRTTPVGVRRARAGPGLDLHRRRAAGRVGRAGRSDPAGPREAPGVGRGSCSRVALLRRLRRERRRRRPAPPPPRRSVHRHSPRSSPAPAADRPELTAVALRLTEVGDLDQPLAMTWCPDRAAALHGREGGTACERCRRTTVLDISGERERRRRAGPARHRLPPGGSCSRATPTGPVTAASTAYARGRPVGPHVGAARHVLDDRTSRPATTTAATSSSAPTACSGTGSATAAGPTTSSATPRRRAIGSAAACGSTPRRRARRSW